MPSLLTLSDVMGTGAPRRRRGQGRAGEDSRRRRRWRGRSLRRDRLEAAGAERIILLGNNPERIALGQEFGATDVVRERGDEAFERVRELTGGLGADSVLECVGLEQAVVTALEVARPGGAIGRVGVPEHDTTPTSIAFWKNASMAGGPAPVRAYIDELLPDVLEGRIEPGRVFDRTGTLDEVPDGYRAMNDRDVLSSRSRSRLSAVRPVPVRLDQSCSARERRPTPASSGWTVDAPGRFEPATRGIRSPLLCPLSCRRPDLRYLCALPRSRRFALKRCPAVAPRLGAPLDSRAAELEACGTTACSTPHTRAKLNRDSFSRWTFIQVRRFDPCPAHLGHPLVPQSASTRATIREEVTGQPYRQSRIARAPGCIASIPEVPVRALLEPHRRGRASRSGSRPNAGRCGHDAIGAAQELHQIVDQLGIVEVNRCQCRRRVPELPAAGAACLTVATIEGRSNWLFVQASGSTSEPGEAFRPHFLAALAVRPVAASG